MNLNSQISNLNKEERNGKENNHLFVYGTLQYGQSRNYILKGLQFKKAVLPNYRKISPPNLGFPVIIRDDTSEVNGEVYFNIEHSRLKQIDYIEGEGRLYNRILVNVKTLDGESLPAYVYYPSNELLKYIL